MYDVAAQTTSESSGALWGECPAPSSRAPAPLALPSRKAAQGRGSIHPAELRPQPQRNTRDKDA